MWECPPELGNEKLMLEEMYYLGKVILVTLSVKGFTGPAVLSLGHVRFRISMRSAWGVILSSRDFTVSAVPSLMHVRHPSSRGT